MAKKNLPNIPIYIGDWERDCNILSLESEMAWMKIIFKLHLSGKQSIYKTSTKGLQILWKSNQEKVVEILEELRFNEICEITEISGGYEFLCRRYKKENDLSKIRSEAVNERYKDVSNTKKPKQKITKPIQKAYKTLQNTEIENENNNDIKSEVLNESDYVKLLMEHGFDKTLISEWFVIRNKKNVVNTTTFFKSFISEVNNSGKDINDILRICVENSWAGFKVEWLNNLNNNKNGKSATTKQKAIYNPDYVSETFKDLQP